jgi:hypothetical protein
LDEYIDRLDMQVHADKASIATIKRDLLNFKAVAGDVEVLKKNSVKVDELQNEVRELRTSMNTLVDLIKSGVASTSNSIADDLVLSAIKDAGASASVPAESKPSGEGKKKKETKATKAKAVLEPKYDASQRDMIKVGVSYLYPSNY